MKSDKRSLWPRILTYFLGTMLFLTVLSRAADSIILPVVKLQRPYPGALKHTVVTSGTIEAREQWPVMAEGFPISRVYVRPGQAVRAGETLLRYDAQALQSKLDAAQAELKKLTWQAQLDALDQGGADAQQAGANQEKAALKQQISRLAMDAAQREVERLSQLLYAGAALTCPADGTVAEVLAKPGDAVTGAAFRLSSAASGLIVRAPVTQAQARHLAPGMEATYRRADQTRAGEGAATVKGISLTATGYEAVFDLPEGAGSIGQGVTVTAARETDTYDVRLPVGALAMEGSAWGVYRIRTGQSVLGDMEYAEFVQASVLDTDGINAAISASLSPQDQVIVSATKPIKAGDRVRSAS